MASQEYASHAARIGKFKGAILKHATPVEVLSRQGKQVKMPQNMSDTYVARRWLPYGATATSAATQNQFFQAGTGDRANALVQAHQIAEGITPTPDSITPVDVQVVMQQYGCLYGFTDKTFHLYEDDVPKAMIEQTGERVGLVNEMIVWGALRAASNVFYGGSGVSLATVNGPLTLNFVRKIVKSLQANHGMEVSRVLKPSAEFDTSAVSGGFFVFCHTDLEPDIRDLPGFTPTEKYASGTPMPREVGKVERFRFIASPDLPSIQDAGAAVGLLGLSSTTGANIDVYPIVVIAQNAFSQLAVRGLSALDPTFIPPGKKDKSDQLGQRGYVGTSWWKACLIENHGWLAAGFVGSKLLN